MKELSDVKHVVPLGLANRASEYMLRLAYRLPESARLRRMAASKPRENDIFIGYAAEDSDFVRALDNAIRHEGLDPWIDFDDIPNFNDSSNVNDQYAQQIKVGILKADAFVLVHSQAALNCSKTMAGLKKALHLNKLIVVVCTDAPEKVPPFPDCLDRLVCFDIRSPLRDRLLKQVAQNTIHLQTYIRLLARSSEWNLKGRPQEYLLTEEDLTEIKKQKHWINTHRLGDQFNFTEVQHAFLAAVDEIHQASALATEKSESERQKGLPDVFISYSRNNKHFAIELSQALKDDGWKVWLDQESIPIAADWRAEAEEGIRQSHTFFFVVCAESIHSTPCRWELERARHYKKRVIPIISQSDYSQNALESIGLSSIQYVSFVRGQRSFDEAFSELLGALKVNLEDLKTYRRLLIKSYEWAEQDRKDQFLLNRQDAREIQRWQQQREHLNPEDQREIEPLLSRQKEYVRASQRYLALQRKWQWFYLFAILTTFFSLSGLLLSKTLGEIRALVTSLEDRKGLDALVIGLQAGKQVQKNDLFIKSLRPRLRSQATTVLHRTALKLREVNRLEEHDGKVFSIVFSPDGRQLISTGEDKSVRFWDLNVNSSKKPSFHAQPVATVAYSSDGKKIATGSRDGVVKLWKPSGQLEKTLPKVHGSHVYQVAFSAGSQYLASASNDGKVFLWTQADDFQRPVVLCHEPESPILSIAFSPDGRYIASADLQGQVIVWSLTGRLLHTFEHGSPIFTLQFSPGRKLLAFAGLSGVIQVQDLERETVSYLSDHDDRIWQIRFSSDGATLASASEDGTVKLWNPRSERGKELFHTLRGHQGPVQRISFGPRDEVLATGGADGVVRLWLTERGTLIEEFEGHDDEISSLDFTANGFEEEQVLLASSSNDGNIRLWDIESPIQPLPHTNQVYDVTFRPDGRVLASSGRNTIRLWRRDGTLRSYIEFSQASKVQAITYSPDGELLAAGGDRGNLKLWKPNIATKEPIQTIKAHAVPEDALPLDQGVLDLSFSPDGNWLASGGSGNALKLWVVEGDKLHQYITLEHSNDVTGVAFSRDSRFLATSTKVVDDTGQGVVTLWEMPDDSQSRDQPIRKFETDRGHSGDILTVAIHPIDAQIIASGDADGKINFWSPSGQLIKPLKEHSDAVTQISFSKDGLFLASSSKDATVRLWTAQGEPISELTRHSREVSSVEFEPDGADFLASASFDNSALLWELWNLSEANITALNQNHKILKMLMSMGCQSAELFLETHRNPSANAPEMSEDDKEELDDIKAVSGFCSRYERGDSASE